jgi:hypothetical protein
MNCSFQDPNYSFTMIDVENILSNDEIAEKLEYETIREQFQK